MSITVAVRTATADIKLKMKFTQNHTVFDIQKAYCDQEDNKKSPEKMTFHNLKNGKEMTPVQQTLGSFGVNGKALMVMMTYHLGGGSQQEEKGENILNSNRYRKLDKSDPDIKITNKACCVYLDKEGDRAEMPCGDAFTPDSMFNTLKGLLTKNDYEYIIKCPACRKEMDFDLCAKIADLNDEEWMYFLGELGKRSAPETKQCPDCCVLCTRPKKLTMMRVNCSACSGGDWCFICAKSWKGGGFTVCGNKDCALYDINKILKDCGTKKTTKDYGEVEIPIIRSCPNCLAFIKHKEACKHMKCEKCGHDFCFACLKPKLNDKWQCGEYMNQCKIAPIQQF